MAFNNHGNELDALIPEALFGLQVVALLLLVFLEDGVGVVQLQGVANAIEGRVDDLRLLGALRAALQGRRLANERRLAATCIPNVKHRVQMSACEMCPNVIASCVDQRNKIKVPHVRANMIYLGA